MIKTGIYTFKNLSLLLLDLSIFIVIYIIPTISHLIGFPLYMIDPMRLLLITGYMLTRNIKNILIISLTLPVFSFLVSGHPLLLKAILISIELTINLFLLDYFMNKTRLNIPLVVFFSIIIGKVIYYMGKYIFINQLLLDDILFATDIEIQLMMVLIITVIFSFLVRRSKFDKNKGSSIVMP